jgi:hypothetical protein
MAQDIYNGTTDDYTSSWRSRGYPLFIIFSSILLKCEFKNAVHSSMYFIWIIAFSFSWIAVKIRTENCVIPNMAIFFLILFLFNERFYFISLLTESLYCSLLLIIFSMISIWEKNKKIKYLFLIGVFLIFSNEVRSLSLIGIGIPFLGFILFNIFYKKDFDCIKYLLSILSGIVICKIIILLVIGLFYNFEYPKRSLAYPATIRILHHDGICKKNNGPSCKKLLDIEKNINKKHRDGSIYENTATYEFIVKKYGVENMEKLYFNATLESIKAYPWISIRNTILNIISFIINYDILFVKERRNSNKKEFPVNPDDWKNYRKHILNILEVNLHYPFWIILSIIIFSKKMRKEIDFTFIIFVAYIFSHILITSITGRYTIRYALPLFTISFIPYIIIFSKRFNFSWPLLFTTIWKSWLIPIYMINKIKAVFNFY